MSLHLSELLTHKEPTNKEISFEKFVKYLFAGVRIAGVDYINTTDDAHYDAFSRVFSDFLDNDEAQLHVEHTDPNKIPGNHGLLNTELLYLQNSGVTEVVGPFFNGVRLSLSREKATRLVERLPEPARAELLEAADEFIEELGPNTHQAE